jgi:UDP-N-acetylmuramoyl-L-alanyl-D-glutamate--2,6-diaminopimelate ligase
MRGLLQKAIPQVVKNWYHLTKSVAAVAYYHYPAKNLKVIGVTGTDGKTTTSTILYKILASAGKKVALISTVGAYVGDKSLDTGFHVTSPDPWSLQKLFTQMVNDGFEYVVLEATSHGLDQHRLLGSNISIGVLTNITHEHLDYHKTYARYLEAKAKLFSSVEVAVLNKDDSSYSKIRSLIPETASFLSYSRKTLSGSIRKTVHSKFPEEYNQLNATAAIQVAQYLGLDSPQIVRGLKSFTGISGRMERVKNSKGINAIVDFAHTPNGLENALKSLKKTTKGRLFAVYGSAGLRDFEKRPDMGKIGSLIADEVFLTAEDPRTESIWKILDQMTSQIDKNIGHVHLIPDREEAIKLAVSLAQKGDTIAVLGKGHEKSMCFGTTEYPWSDQEALRKALKD